MKSLEELKKLRDEAKKKIEMRDGHSNYRIVVGMGTCGIAAGARPVLNTLVEELSRETYSCTVTQTGCIGMCVYEPIVEIFNKEGKKTTYVHVTPEKAKEILESHIAKDTILEQYTVNSVK